VPEAVVPEPVFLVDDMVDSRWSMTVCGVLLVEAGCGAVAPLAWAETTKGAQTGQPLPVSADGQAIAHACSGLALQGDRSLKPLSAREWHDLSPLLQRSAWDRPRSWLAVDLRNCVNLSDWHQS
jgi:hypothetical protein